MEYRNEFRFHGPHEYRPAGRPAKTTPLYPVLGQQGAHFGTVNGWERALLQSVSPRGDWSATAFPWLAVRERDIGSHHVLAMAVSFSGESDFELHAANENRLASVSPPMWCRNASTTWPTSGYAHERPWAGSPSFPTRDTASRTA